MRPKWSALAVVHSENQTEYQHKHLIPVVNHSGGGVMIWGCFFQLQDLVTL